MVARLRSGPAGPHPQALDGLPPPVARYLRAVLPESPAIIRYARLEQRGEFLLRPAPDGWRPFTAVEHFAASPPGFVWDARIRMAAGLSVFVRDGLVGGSGSMVGSVLGAWRVVAVEGTPALASAALQRYLAEAAWIPTAFLPGTGVVWTPLGPTSARATLTVTGATASVDFHFGADGLIERVYTHARERDLGGGRTAPTPWQGRFSRYELRGGFRIPLAGEVEWVLSDGPAPYWRGEITGVAYEVTPGLEPVSPRVAG